MAGAGNATGSHFFEFDGTSLIPVPGDSQAAFDPPYMGRMLELPTGQILFTDGATVELYTSSGTYQNAWRPTISSFPPSVAAGGLSYSISGTQFNGLTQGAMYGDDAQSATNYPLVRITNSATGHVFYARTHHHSTMAVAISATVVAPPGTGYVTLYPGNGSLPLAATLNFTAGTTRSNNAIVALATDASGTFGAQSLVGGGGGVELVIDVAGYYK